MYYIMFWLNNGLYICTRELANEVIKAVKNAYLNTDRIDNVKVKPLIDFLLFFQLYSNFSLSF